MSKTPQKVDRAAFVASNPRCCYCAGRRPTTEIDHAPARIIFIKKHGPEGFLFPSCSECNRIAGLSEQVMAFYIRSFDRSAGGLDEAEFAKLASGLINNVPAAVPQLPPRPSHGLALFTHGIYEADRATTVPPAAKAHIELFALKVLYALYYRVTGRFAGSSNRYLLTWAQTGTDAARLMLATADNWFDEHEIGQRRNIDLGDQFRFQYGYHQSHGFFGVRMSFAGAFVMFGVIGPARQMAKLKDRDPLCPAIYVAGKRIEKRWGRRARGPLA
ncbi:HNH endonuclease [Sphingomonas sp. UYP23]